MRERLRIGVGLDAGAVPAWIAHVIRTLRVSPQLEVALVLRGPAAARSARKDLFSRYAAFDARRFGRDPDALGLEDVEAALAGCPTAEPGDRAALATARLDVLLLLGLREERGAMAGAARHGSWVFLEDHFHQAPLVHPWLRGEPVLATTLCRLAADGSPGELLARGFGTNDLSSLQRSRSPAYWRTAEMLLRELLRLAAEGGAAWEAGLVSRAPRAEAAATDALSVRGPGAVSTLRRGGRLAARFARNRLRERLFDEDWCVAVRRSRVPREPGISLAGFHFLPSPADRYYADPFPWVEGDRRYVFCEEYRKRERKGVIVVFEVDDAGRPGPPRLVLERDYHLSYPFVFRWQGQHYMIPETEQHRTIELHRARRFPNHWEPDKVLMEGVLASDTTLFEHAGCFWLFTCMRSERGAGNEETFLFHAADPLGPFVPHRDNPIVSDVRRARPAGRIFRLGEHWVRPSQDCARCYGHAITLSRIDELTPERYRETPIGRIAPESVASRAFATHTWNRHDDLETIDARILRRRFRL
jgi:hypothetical protein